ncbi:hypothetical protein PybrP1_000695 [[Pythium] brassicae (nom. inval.)]|nr:hypothetical protein PybrP1_000695 [[Pythium] brassicae (nom. inval.)]
MSATATSYHRRRLAIPLTAVSTVCHARLGLDLSLAHEISAFIASDSHRGWTIELACECGHEQLLRRLVALEPADTDPFLRSHVFSKALVHAVRHDNLALLESLRDYCPNGFASWGMEEAAALGKAHLLEWIGTNCDNIVWSPRIFDAAAGRGHIAALEWLTAYWSRLNGGRSTETEVWGPCGAMEYAAKAGHFETARWLYENVNRFVENEYRECMSMRGAIESGCLEIIEYLHDVGYRLNLCHLTDAIELALSGGCDDVAVIEWLQEYAYWGTTGKACAIAAERGCVDIVRWVLKNGYSTENRDSALQAAAKHGHLEVVQVLAPHCSDRCYEQALADAAAGGHVAVVEWIFGNLRAPEGRCTADRNAVALAAAHGHLATAGWLHARIVPDPHMAYSSSEAATLGNLDGLNGNFEMLVWMRDTFGYEFSWAPEHLLDEAAARGHEIVQWLHAQQDPIERCSTKAMNNAARNNHLHIVKWLHENRSEGCTTAAMDAAASLEMVAWLHENRSEGCTTLAMDNAARNGDLETLIFLHAHYTAGCTVEAASDAYFGEHVDVFKWLVAHFPDELKADVVRERIALECGSSLQYVSSLLESL